jgi:hypothetical protein
MKVCTNACLHVDTRGRRPRVCGIGEHTPAADTMHSCLPLCDAATTVPPPTMRTASANATLDSVVATLRSSAPSALLHAILATVMALPLPCARERACRPLLECACYLHFLVSCSDYVAVRGCGSLGQHSVEHGRDGSSCWGQLLGSKCVRTHLDLHLGGQHHCAHPAVMPASRRETGPASASSVPRLGCSSGTSKLHSSLAASSDTDRACKHRTQR